METIRNYIDNLFRNYPATPRVQKAREELLGDLACCRDCLWYRVCDREGGDRKRTFKMIFRRRAEAFRFFSSP